jgi:heterodisulfide reductase subunit C
MMDFLNASKKMDSPSEEDWESWGIRRCYQCQSCSAGCPVLDLMDVPPHRAVWMAAHGNVAELLQARSPWVCVGCLSCTERCPNEVNVVELWARIRKAVSPEAAAPQVEERTFHRLFLQGIRRHGRQNELSLVMRFRLSTLNPLRDFWLGLRMAFKGKVVFVPPVRRKDSRVAGLFEEREE